MSITFRNHLLIAIALISSVASADMYRQRVSDFCRAIRVDEPESMMTIASDRIVMVDAKTFTVTFRPESTRISSYTNLDLEKSQNSNLFDPRVPLVDEAAIDQRAGEILDIVGAESNLALFSREIRGELDSEGRPVRRGNIKYVFSTTINGISSGQSGNYVSIHFDYQTGELRSITNEYGYSYQSPDGLPTAEEARTILIDEGHNVRNVTPITIYANKAAKIRNTSDRSKCVIVHVFPVEGKTVEFVAETGDIIINEAAAGKIQESKTFLSETPKQTGITDPVENPTERSATIESEVDKAAKSSFPLPTLLGTGLLTVAASVSVLIFRKNRQK